MPRPITSDFGRDFNNRHHHHHHHHQGVNGGNGGNSSIGINPSFDAPNYLQRRNFNAPAASIRRHHPPRRSFANQSFHRQINYRPPYEVPPRNQNNYYDHPYEIPPRNQNNYLRHYRIPPAQQDSDLRRNEISPHLRNEPRHHQNFPAQPLTMRIRIANFVVTLQDGVDIELTPEEYQAIRVREILRAREISRAREILYDRMQQMLLQRMLEEEAREMRSGWTEEDIMKCLKTRSNDASLGNDQENTICTICQDEYQIEDMIGTLDCQHEFHRDCIKDWLLRNNICPICRRPALNNGSSTN
ncbi:hypothetical protein Syun_017416 [Stephania yunnanensis]|uniref:RING-type E3 ubiquitin transferase n=1 Tax=Stephania yunnanensis TaxID=152371 RepID=A0AAP0P3C7_9MAGN